MNFLRNLEVLFFKVARGTKIRGKSMRKYISTGTIQVNLTFGNRNPTIIFYPDKNHICTRSAKKYAIFLGVDEAKSETRIDSIINKLDADGGIRLELRWVAKLDADLKQQIQILGKAAIESSNVDVDVVINRKHVDGKLQEYICLVSVRIPSTDQFKAY